jgi:hypothetical protein
LTYFIYMLKTNHNRLDKASDAEKAWLLWPPWPVSKRGYLLPICDHLPPHVFNRQKLHLYFSSFFFVQITGWWRKCRVLYLRLMHLQIACVFDTVQILFCLLLITLFQWRFRATKSFDRRLPEVQSRAYEVIFELFEMGLLIFCLIVRYFVGFLLLLVVLDECGFVRKNSLLSSLQDES